MEDLHSVLIPTISAPKNSEFLIKKKITTWHISRKRLPKKVEEVHKQASKILCQIPIKQQLVQFDWVNRIT
jgi:hypothetical protein